MLGTETGPHLSFPGKLLQEGLQQRENRSKEFKGWAVSRLSSMALSPTRRNCTHWIPMAFLGPSRDERSQGKCSPETWKDRHAHRLRASRRGCVCKNVHIWYIYGVCMYVVYICIYVVCSWYVCVVSSVCVCYVMCELCGMCGVCAYVVWYVRYLEMEGHTISNCSHVLSFQSLLAESISS